MLEYKIEELKLENLDEAIKVIETTFMKFEAPDYSKEGIENFFKFANYENIRTDVRVLLEYSQVSNEVWKDIFQIEELPEGVER